MPKAIHVGCKITDNEEFEMPGIELYDICNCPRCGTKCQYFVSFNTGVGVLVNLK